MIIVTAEIIILKKGSTRNHTIQLKIIQNVRNRKKEMVLLQLGKEIEIEEDDTGIGVTEGVETKTDTKEEEIGIEEIEIGDTVEEKEIEVHTEKIDMMMRLLNFKLKISMKKIMY